MSWLSNKMIIELITTPTNGSIFTFLSPFFNSWLDIRWFVRFLNHCTEGKSVETQGWQFFTLETWVEWISCASIPGTHNWSKNKLPFEKLHAEVEAFLSGLSKNVYFRARVNPGFEWALSSNFDDSISFPLWGFPCSSTDPYHPRAVWIGFVYTSFWPFVRNVAHELCWPLSFSYICGE